VGIAILSFVVTYAGTSCLGEAAAPFRPVPVCLRAVNEKPVDELSLLAGDFAVARLVNDLPIEFRPGLVGCVHDPFEITDEWSGIVGLYRVRSVAVAGFLCGLPNGSSRAIDDVDRAKAFGEPVDALTAPGQLPRLPRSPDPASGIRIGDQSGPTRRRAR